MGKSVEYLFALLLFGMFLVGGTETCLWSNEHCSRDSDCCSGSCFRAFEGTNPRCRHSSLKEICIFNFHCADDLECGPQFNCCSPYWKMCMKTRDCCDPMHVCKPADGFYYNRCLYPNAAPVILPPMKWFLLVLHTLVVFVGVSFSSSSLWQSVPCCSPWR